RGRRDRRRVRWHDHRVRTRRVPSRETTMLSGFKEFILRGNVVELAVAVVIGTAFATVVDRVVDGIVNPLIAAIGGAPNLHETWFAELNVASFTFAAVVGAIISFLITAAFVYLLIVLPMNRLSERRKDGAESEPEAPAEDVLLLQEIRDLLAAQRRDALG